MISTSSPSHPRSPRRCRKVSSRLGNQSITYLSDRSMNRLNNQSVIESINNSYNVSFITMSLRRILGYRWYIMSNDLVLRGAGLRQVTCIVRERQLRLYGHVARLPADDNVHRILPCRFPSRWTTPRGRHRLHDCVNLSVLKCRFFKSISRYYIVQPVFLNQ